MPIIERDVLERLESHGLRWYVTGSWSLGLYAELQMRDVRSLVRLVGDLDWPYLERYAGALGIGDRVEAIRGE